MSRNVTKYVWILVGFKRRSTGHSPITRFDQPSYYRFQTLELFAVVNLARGQLVDNRFRRSYRYTFALTFVYLFF
jgi:hypothetical protein